MDWIVNVLVKWAVAVSLSIRWRQRMYRNELFKLIPMQISCSIAVEWNGCQRTSHIIPSHLIFELCYQHFKWNLNMGCGNLKSLLFKVLTFRRCLPHQKCRRKPQKQSLVICAIFDVAKKWVDLLMIVNCAVSHIPTICIHHRPYLVSAKPHTRLSSVSSAKVQLNAFKVSGINYNSK